MIENKWTEHSIEGKKSIEITKIKMLLMKDNTCKTEMMTKMFFEETNKSNKSEQNWSRERREGKNKQY